MLCCYVITSFLFCLCSAGPDIAMVDSLYNPGALSGAICQSDLEELFLVTSNELLFPSVEANESFPSCHAFSLSEGNVH